MKLYVYDIEESYKDTIIVNLIHSGREGLLLHIVQYWHACTFSEENRLYLRFCTIQTWCINIILIMAISESNTAKEGKYIYSEIFNNISHFFKSVFMSTLFRMVLLCTIIKWYCTKDNSFSYYWFYDTCGLML